MNNNIELLAPVGSMDALYAAIQNGANAVYLGGKLFNARQYASNFDSNELKEAVSYAHLRQVKIYVTVNILIDNGEIEEAIDYIKFLYEIDIDGLIVQDLGLASLIREFFPEIEVHGSTQMTINNLSGAEFLYNMGFKRIVLARETPIDEIKYIHNNTPIELETFIHGALCVSYSGQCLMSSLIGGRSGNRGTCAQPCRMPSSLVDKSGKLIDNWDKKHILSTKDLNSLDSIDKIIDSGVVSLKIEGRMKRPEYVATVVKNYRKALDNGVEDLKEEDKKDVEQIFNRGFTKGIGMGDWGSKFVTIDRPDNKGLLLGRVIRADKYKVYVLLDEDIGVGDGLEFQLRDGEYTGIKSPIDAKAGSTISLEKPGYILNDTLVYKSSSVELLSRAKDSYQGENIKYPIYMEASIKIGEKPYLKIKYRDESIEVLGEKVVEVAKKLGLTEEKIKEQLSKLGDTNYEISYMQLSLDENAFLPLSVLNSLRREATDALDKIIRLDNHREVIDDKDYKEKKKSIFQYKRQERDVDNKISIRVMKEEQFKQLDLEKMDRIYIGFYDNLEAVISKVKEYNKEVYIWTDKILYERDLEEMKMIIKPIESLIDGISVSNLGTMKYMMDNFDLKIHGDIGLNIFNSFTLEYLNKLNLASLTLSPELTLNQIKNINNRSNVVNETIVYGHLPAMVTKYCPMSLVKGCKDDRDCETCNFASGYKLKDRIKVEFPIERRKGLTTIYNSVPLMVLDSLVSIYNSGVNMARLDFTVEKDNIKYIQEAFYDYAKNYIDDNRAKEIIADYRRDKDITNGHYFRGVL